MTPKLDGLVSAGLMAMLGMLPACSSSSGLDTTDAAPVDAGASDSDAHVLHDAPHDAGTDGRDAGPTEAEECTECLAAHCPGELTYCGRTGDCLAIAECAGDKLDPVSCICSHPSGATAFLELARCKLQEACSPDCQSSCLDVKTQASCDVTEAGVATPSCDGGLAVSEASVADCTGCVQVSCSIESARCGEGSDCVAYEACLFACHAGDPRCAGACQTEHPEGYGLVQSLYDCESQNCSSSCGG